MLSIDYRNEFRPVGAALFLTVSAFRLVILRYRPALFEDTTAMCHFLVASFPWRIKREWKCFAEGDYKFHLRIHFTRFLR